MKLEDILAKLSLQNYSLKLFAAYSDSKPTSLVLYKIDSSLINQYSENA